MAGIFNLFGEILEPDKGLEKKMPRSKTSLGITGNSVKNVGPSKPKGLSIRSNSDLNIPVSVQDTPNKQKELLKPKLTQLDSDGLPISPKKDLLLKKTIGSSDKIKDASPRKVLDEKDIKLSLPSDEYVFKKPKPPKYRIKKSYPEPEILAPYFNVQFEFDNIYTNTIENEFKQFFMKKENEVDIYDDEGFESDPEQIEFEMPEFCTSELFDEGKIECKTPNLPEISDDDSF